MPRDHIFPDLADIAEALRACDPDADALLAELTGWRSVDDMLARERCSAYFPTCRLDLDARYARVADIFDECMRRLGDDRRAWRVGEGAA